jgi:hypothetical protein
MTTTAQNQIIADKAFTVDLHIRQLKKVSNQTHLELARLLKEVRDNKYYEVLGEATFESYIARPELGFSKSSVYRFIGIYETYIEKLKVPHEVIETMDYNKLDIIRPYIKEDNKDEMLSLATGNSRSDLNKSLVEMKLKSEPIVEEHLIKCPVCGFLFSKEDIHG